MGTLWRFIQPVTTSGYNWVDVKNPRHKEVPESPEHVAWLTDGIPLGVEREVIFYNALAKPRLFREFAEMAHCFSEGSDAAKRQITKFANRYGLLGISSYLREWDELATRFGEYLEEWTSAIRDMFLAVELWDNIKNRNLDALERCIQWHDKAVVYKSESLKVADGEMVPMKWAMVAHKQGGTRHAAVWESLQETGTGGYIKPALWLLQRCVNEALNEAISGVLVWQGRLGKGQFEFHYQPTNLLSAMWCQLAREIAVNEYERVCEHCGKPLADIKRSTKRFCSDNCRVKHSQRLKRLCMPSQRAE